MNRLLVLDVVGLTPRLLPHMPNLAALGTPARLDTVLPAVTCPVQSTFLTGELPAGHGIVGNGWYFRDLGDILFWRQHNSLVGGEKIWHTARRHHPDYTVANICWWYAMGADINWTITPRPIYRADGRKDPDCYTWPPQLHDELPPFPLFHYWGPTAGLKSSQWIVDTTRHLHNQHHPDLTLAYLPHLDYDLQRHHPHGPHAARAATDLDTILAPLLADARRAGTTIIALSEYGLTPVTHPIHLNRILRRAGLLNVHTQAGMEYLDPWTSRAFAVADHQIAHIYIRDPADTPTVAALVNEVAQIVDKHAHGLDHPRSGDLIALAPHNAWFTYYYWLNDDRAPDFARTVEIHRKPGYDPTELHFTPGGKTTAALALARKKLGLRYTLNTVPLDPTLVHGSHGRLPDDPNDGPVLLASDSVLDRDRYAATEVKELLLSLAGTRTTVG